MMKRYPATWLAGVSLFFLLGGFAWGFFSYRNKFFPFPLLRSAMERGQRARQISSRSPERAQLRSLPYLQGMTDPHFKSSGVLLYRKEKCWDGLNYYDSIYRDHSALIDMRGHVLHEWKYLDAAQWTHSQMLPDGGLLLALRESAFVRIDRNSKQVWRVQARAHHDFWTDGRSIFTLTHQPEMATDITARHPSLVDYVTVLDASNGKVLSSFSLLDVFRHSPYAFLLPALGHLQPGVDYRREEELDLLHTNHIEVFDGSVAGRSPLFQKGNILLSFRNLNAIAILDGRSHQILWLWGPTNLVYQHHPVLLANGHLLIFNNGTDHRSEVLELDPLSRQITWSYAPRDGFFSATKGANQRLPNGNTLITESDHGYVREVTPQGEVVWTFANPDVEARFRSAIWRMVRVSPSDVAFLEK